LLLLIKNALADHMCGGYGVALLQALYQRPHISSALSTIRARKRSCWLHLLCHHDECIASPAASTSPRLTAHALPQGGFKMQLKSGCDGESYMAPALVFSVFVA
jgi:hypothetical protein